VIHLGTRAVLAAAHQAPEVLMEESARSRTAFEDGKGYRRGCREGIKINGLHNGHGTFRF